MTNNAEISFIAMAFFISLVPYFFSWLLKKKSSFLKRYYIPHAFIAGFAILLFTPNGASLLGDQFVISEKLLSTWQEMAIYMVNIIFACMFLGKTLPTFKQSFNLVIPQASLGQTLAWGQYTVGALLVLFLSNWIDIPPAYASLIEISFQGGIAIALSMKPTFESIGITNAHNIAMGLAPLAMITGVISGIVLINIYKRDRPIQQNEDQMPPPPVRSMAKQLLIPFFFIGVSIFSGQLILLFLKLVEDHLFLGSLYQSSMVKHIPLFPMALLGGLFVQLFLNFIGKFKLIEKNAINMIQQFMLDLVIIMAMANINFNIISENIYIFVAFFVTGFTWNILCFLFLSKLIMGKYWFVRGIADYGQSMGTTSIGLILLRIVDPHNKKQGRDSFALKQVLFEPFVGGGIITALSPIIIHRLGLITFTFISSGLCLLFFLIGFLFHHRSSASP